VTDISKKKALNPVPDIWAPHVQMDNWPTHSVARPLKTSYHNQHHSLSYWLTAINKNFYSSTNS